MPLCSGWAPVARAVPLQGRRVLEVGCGPDLLVAQVLESPTRVTEWQVVEPAQRYADIARAFAAREPRLRGTTDYTEPAEQHVTTRGQEGRHDAFRGFGWG